MAKKVQVINVCQKHGLECGKEIFPATAKGKKLYFCCGAGFARSLEDFRESKKQKLVDEVER